MPGTRRKKEKTRVTWFLLLAAAVLVTDQVTKHIVLRLFQEGQSLPVFPDIFHLTLVHNKGIAFGLFRDHEPLLFILISASILFLTVFGIILARSGGLVAVSMALILGGAFGNWLDRVRYQAVIDFLDFRIWPVFNVADTAISTGVALYLIAFFRESRRSGGQETAAGGRSEARPGGPD